MKSIKILAAGLLLFSTSAIFAQAKVDNSTTRKISYGIKGGVNFSRVTGDDIDNQEARTNFHAGLFVEVPLADIFSIQAEALYSGEGFKSKYSDPLANTTQKAEYQLDYINVPVLAKVYVTKGLSIEAGPQFDFKVDEKIDNKPTVEGGATDTDFASNFSFGVAGGLTFQTEFGLFASGRYTYGLTNIAKADDVDLRNSVFQISLGYKF
jgi:hypothetical protein